MPLCAALTSLAATMRSVAGPCSIESVRPLTSLAPKPQNCNQPRDAATMANGGIGSVTTHRYMPSTQRPSPSHRWRGCGEKGEPATTCSGRAGEAAGTITAPAEP